MIAPTRPVPMATPRASASWSDDVVVPISAGAAVFRTTTDVGLNTSPIPAPATPQARMASGYGTLGSSTRLTRTMPATRAAVPTVAVCRAGRWVRDCHHDALAHMTAAAVSGMPATTVAV